MTKEEAAKAIAHDTKEKASYIKRNFHEDIASPAHYDLIINSAKLPLEATEQAIFSAYSAKFGKHLEMHSAKEFAYAPVS